MNIGMLKRITHYPKLSQGRIAHQYLFAAAFVAITLASVLCAAGKYREAIAVSLIALASGYMLSSRTSVESVLIFWFATSPLASFYVRFPFDKSVITYNRAMIALSVAMLALRSWTRALRSRAVTDFKPEIENEKFNKSAFIEQFILRFSATRFEIAWALLSLLALASAVIWSNDAPYAAKLAVDSFILPLVAFHVARHHFDAQGRVRAIMFAAIALALFLFLTGAYEFATGTNLFQYKGSELVREGERRVNGPFAADSSYAIISLMLALFLQAMPPVLRARFDKTSRLIYSCALAAAVLASLLPLFRATAIALVICSIILKVAGDKSAEAKKSNPFRSLLGPGSLLAVIVITLLLGAMSLGYFSFARRLTDPRNAFGRLATWEAAAGIALENPLFGVGLANYPEYFYEKYNWEDESVEQVMNTRAANSPHSNLFWIAAELGFVAFALYVTANVYLFLIGWRGMKRASGLRERTTAACYLALFAAYWIPGLTLASGYYSDLNLYFFFMLGLLSNRSLVSSNRL